MERSQPGPTGPGREADSVSKIRVYIADDHPLVRAGVRATLAEQDDIELVGEAADGQTTLDQCLSTKPDLLVLDLSMPGPPPEEIIQQLRTEDPELKTLVLTAHAEREWVQRALQARVSGYLLKEEVGEVLLQAIRAIHRGAAWFTQSVALQMMQPPRPDPAAELTPREREILERIAKGLDNHSIAKELHLAEQTVRNYASTVYEKLGVKSRVEAVVWAREHGLV